MFEGLKARTRYMLRSSRSLTNRQWRFASKLSAAEEREADLIEKLSSFIEELESARGQASTRVAAILEESGKVAAELDAIESRIKPLLIKTVTNSADVMRLRFRSAADLLSEFSALLASLEADLRKASPTTSRDGLARVLEELQSDFSRAYGKIDTIHAHIYTALERLQKAYLKLETGISADLATMNPKALAQIAARDAKTGSAMSQDIRGAQDALRGISHKLEKMLASSEGLSAEGLDAFTTELRSFIDGMDGLLRSLQEDATLEFHLLAADLQCIVKDYQALRRLAQRLERSRGKEADHLRLQITALADSLGKSSAAAGNELKGSAGVLKGEGGFLSGLRHTFLAKVAAVSLLLTSYPMLTIAAAAKTGAGQKPASSVAQQHMLYLQQVHEGRMAYRLMVAELQQILKSAPSLREWDKANPLAVEHLQQVLRTIERYSGAIQQANLNAILYVQGSASIDGRAGADNQGLADRRGELLVSEINQHLHGRGIHGVHAVPVRGVVQPLPDDIPGLTLERANEAVRNVQGGTASQQDAQIESRLQKDRYATVIGTDLVPGATQQIIPPAGDPVTIAHTDVLDRVEIFSDAHLYLPPIGSFPRQLEEAERKAAAQGFSYPPLPPFPQPLPPPYLLIRRADREYPWIRTVADERVTPVANTRMGYTAVSWQDLQNKYANLSRDAKRKAELMYRNARNQMSPEDALAVYQRALEQFAQQAANAAEFGKAAAGASKTGRTWLGQKR